MLTSRLESSSTELRIAAGEAIAVVYEAVLEADEVCVVWCGVMWHGGGGAFGTWCSGDKK